MSCVNPHPTGFIGATLDRAERLRGDPDALAALAARPDARWLLFEDGSPLATRQADGRLVPAWLTAADIAGEPNDLQILLGLEPCPHSRHGPPRFAISGRQGPLPGELADLRAITAELPAPEAAVLAQAASMLGWHRRHGFCANCGQPTEPGKAGYLRKCPACGTEHFPRVDPVVIMLATHGDMALVGRGKRFPPGFYSALAGFVEPGESLEEAVARELDEEAGVTATSVRYVASQPWPFQSNLMLGAFAEVDGLAITLDPHELEDAKWVTRADLRAAFAGDGPMRVPPPFAIAHLLLRLWTDSAA